VRSIAFHLPEIDPSPSISYPRRLNTAVELYICVLLRRSAQGLNGQSAADVVCIFNGTVQADVCVFNGTEYRQMCAYLTGQSTGRCARI
jgi:hypothetical protein